MYIYIDNTTNRIMHVAENNIFTLSNTKVVEYYQEIPSDILNYLYIDGQFVVDTTFVFTQLQEVKVNEIKTAFNTDVKSGYTCSNGITMDADLSDILSLKAGYDLAVSLEASTMDITDYNDVTHSGLAVADVFTMIIELGVNYDTLRVKKNTLKAQVNSATTIDELEAIVW